MALAGRPCINSGPTPLFTTTTPLHSLCCSTPSAAPPKQKKRRRSKSSNGSDSEGGSESDDGDWQEGDAAEPAAAADGAGSSGLATRRGTRFGAGVGDDQAVVCESKLRALLAELTAMRAADPSSKVRGTPSGLRSFVPAQWIPKTQDNGYPKPSATLHFEF